MAHGYSPSWFQPTTASISSTAAGSLTEASVNMMTFLRNLPGWPSGSYLTVRVEVPPGGRTVRPAVASTQEQVVAILVRAIFLFEVLVILNSRDTGEESSVRVSSRTFVRSKARAEESEERRGLEDSRSFSSGMTLICPVAGRAARSIATRSGTVLCTVGVIGFCSTASPGMRSRFSRLSRNRRKRSRPRLKHVSGLPQDR